MILISCVFLKLKMYNYMGTIMYTILRFSDQIKGIGQNRLRSGGKFGLVQFQTRLLAMTEVIQDLPMHTAHMERLSGHAQEGHLIMH